MFLGSKLTHYHLLEESPLDMRHLDLLGQILKLKIKYASWKAKVVFFKGAPGGETTYLCPRQRLKASVEFKALYQPTRYRCLS